MNHELSSQMHCIPLFRGRFVLFVSVSRVKSEFGRFLQFISTVHFHTTAPGKREGWALTNMFNPATYTCPKAGTCSPVVVVVFHVHYYLFYVYAHLVEGRSFFFKTLLFRHYLTSWNQTRYECWGLLAARPFFVIFLDRKNQKKEKIKSYEFTDSGNLRRIDKRNLIWSVKKHGRRY